jgi:hypothetical protein
LELISCIVRDIVGQWMIYNSHPKQTYEEIWSLKFKFFNWDPWAGNESKLSFNSRGSCLIYHTLMLIEEDYEKFSHCFLMDQMLI